MPRLQKIPFDIVSASSYDPEYPPGNLLVHNHSPLARGWHSDRFCLFPQVLVLRLTPGRCRVRKIQILAHHYKIPTRLEFFLGMSAAAAGKRGRAVDSGVGGGGDAGIERLGSAAEGLGDWDDREDGDESDDEDAESDDDGEYDEGADDEDGDDNDDDAFKIEGVDGSGGSRLVRGGGGGGTEFLPSVGPPLPIQTERRRGRRLGADGGRDWRKQRRRQRVRELLRPDASVVGLKSGTAGGIGGVEIVHLNPAGLAATAGGAAGAHDSPPNSTGTEVHVKFVRLGYVSLTDNVATAFKARELKSIHLDSECDFLKLVVHKNYINSLNLYNQVGIVAINLLGEVEDAEFYLRSLSDQQAAMLGLDPLAASNQIGIKGAFDLTGVQSNLSASSVKDLAFDLFHDEDIAKLMSSIADMKSAAVSAENFGQAKTLKTLYQLAKKAGEEIARLQVTKAKAIESEDYETAEDAKIDIEVIKSALRSKIGELGFRTTPVGGIEAIPEDILERQRQAARREIEASSTVKFKIPDETTVDEPREAQASRTPDDAPAPLVEEFPVISNSLSPNRRNQTPVTSPVQNLLKETTKVASPSGPSSRSVTNLNTEGRMPGDGGKSTKEKSSTEPEPLPADLDDALSHSAEVHGAYLVRCALSRQFKFREWAMEELAKRLDIWDRIQEQSGRTSLQHSSSPGRLARTEGGNQAGKRPVNEGPSRLGTERILSKESLFSSKESLSPKKGLTDVGSKASNDLVLTVFVDYEQEMPAPRVSPDVFLSSTLPIVRKGMDDIREKMTLQALAIWDEVTRLSTKYGIAPHSIYKNVEAMIPSLITKCGDMNSRVRQGSMELFATLAEAYHSVPYSICRSVLKSHTAAKQPGNGARSAVLPLRLTKARLEVLAFLVKEFGVDDPEAGRLREEETGLTIEAVMKAAKLELQHRSSEVREAAVRVIVELIVRAGEDVVADKLGNIPEQQMQLIRDKLAAARGVAALPRTRKRGATPWKSESLDDQKEDAVQKLQNELEALKDLVEESERKGPSRTRTRTYEKAKVAEAVKPIETASQTKQGQESTSRPPSANPVIAQTKNTDKPKTAAEELADFAASWERICIFCEQSNPAFTEEALDIHYWKDCPMLTGCPLCNQIVEVPVLTSHMLTECDNRSLVKMCSRCQEAVLASEYLPHISRQTCMPASQVPGVSRCPLCHFDVPNGEQGWKRHLLHGNGCPEQERKPPPPRPIPRQPPPPNHEPVQPALKSPQRRAAREPTMTPMGLSPSLRTAGGSGSRATIRSSKPSPSPTPTSPASPASPVSPASPTGTRAASRASKTPVALKMRASPRTPAPMDGVKDGRRSGGVSTSAVGSSLEAKGSGTATVRARKSLESIQLAGGAGVGSTSVPGSFVGRGGLATAATGVASRKATVRRSTGNLK